MKVYPDLVNNEKIIQKLKKYKFKGQKGFKIMLVLYSWVVLTLVITDFVISFIILAAVWDPVANSIKPERRVYILVGSGVLIIWQLFTIRLMQ